MKKLTPKREHQKPPERAFSWTQIIADPWGFLAWLKSLVDEANEKKLSVFIEPLRQQYPDEYRWAESLVDQQPAEIRQALIARWPVLNLVSLKYPLEIQLRMIGSLQNQIRLRREGEKHAPNGKRQIKA